MILLPISDRHNGYARELQEQLVGEGFRVKSDLRNEKVNVKVRKAQLEKIPYMVIIGDKELENKSLAVRNRFEGDLGTFSFEKFLELVKDLRDKKSVRP
jgi:threonyl-tRNA synthetase